MSPTLIWKNVSTDDDSRNIVLLVCLSLIIKVIVVSNAGAVNPDCVHYADAAYKILQGDWAASFDMQKSLGYTTTLGLTFLLVNDWVLAGQIISTIFLTLTLIPLYLITREIFGARSALWSGIAFCLMPAVNELASFVVKDAPFLFFILSSLWFGCRSFSSHRLSGFLLTFCCAVLSASFRFEGVLFLLSYLFWLLYYFLFSPVMRSKISRGLMVFFGIPFILAGIFLTLSFVGVVESTLIEKILRRYSLEFTSINPLESYNTIYENLKNSQKNALRGNLLNNFYQIARNNILLIYLIGLIEVLVKTIYPAYFIALLYSLKKTSFSKDNIKFVSSIAIVFFIMSYYFIVTRDFMLGRYIMIVVFMLLPFVGYGFEKIRASFSDSKRFRKTIATTMLIFFIVLPLYKSFADNWHKKIEIPLAGEWLKNNRDIANNKVITTDKRIPFYAGLLSDQYKIFPGGDDVDYEEIAKQNSSSIMVIDLPAENFIASPKFSHYVFIRDFRGEKRSVFIYEKIAPQKKI